MAVAPEVQRPKVGTRLLDYILGFAANFRLNILVSAARPGKSVTIRLSWQSDLPRAGDPSLLSLCNEAQGFLDWSAGLLPKMHVQARRSSDAAGCRTRKQGFSCECELLSGGR